MNMQKILAFLLCLCTLVFAESQEMRVGDSQYFKSGASGDKLTKITLVGVQNGVAVLKKENVEKEVENIDYFYLAPHAETVAPISLQPYPSVVYDANVKIRGIAEPGQGVFVWKAGADKVFENSQKVLEADIVYNGSSFSVELPLEMGNNTYFLSYEDGVVGNRAEVNILRIDPPADMLTVDLDPIGSDDIRKTNMVVSNAKPGKLVGYETIMGLRTVKTSREIEKDGSIVFSAANTLIEFSERMFDVSLFDYKEDLVASRSFVVPVDDIVPECAIAYDSPNFTPTHSLTGSFKDNVGVRFVWARILDYRGNEFGRSFYDLEKMMDGNFSIHYGDLKKITFKVYDRNMGQLREMYLNLPDEQIKNGEEFFLEIGVTDKSGNRSNTYIYNLFESEYEKVIDIPLDYAAPVENIYDYPVLVHLNRENFVFTKTLENGDDIVFFDADGKRLASEKERFLRDERVAEFWVRIPIVRANSTKIRLKVRWGNPLADSYDGSLVWKESFKGVYHFNEEFRGPYVISNKNYHKKTIYTTGILSLGERTVLNGSFQSNGNESLAVEPLPMPGLQNAVVRSGSKVSLAPGNYGNLIVEPNSQVSLSAGTYHFKNVTLDNDSKVLVDVDAGLVVVKAAENMVMRDRVGVTFAGKVDPSAIRFDVMGSSIQVGYDAKINGVLTAPNANMDVQDRVEWNGALYAKNLNLGMDCTINGTISQTVYSYAPNAAKIFPSKSIKDYAIYAKNSLSVYTQSRIYGNVGSEQKVLIAEGAKIDGNMLAWNDAELRSQSSLSGSAVVGGEVTLGYNVTWDGNAVPLSKRTPMTIGDVYTQIGTKRVAVQRGMKFVIEPGVYEDLVVGENGKAILQDGIYYFGSVTLANEASVEIERYSDDVELVVSNQLLVENRAKINSADRRLTVKFAGTAKVLVGTDCVVNGTFVLPNSDFSLGDRSSMKGSLWAQNVVLGNQVSFMKGSFEITDDFEIAATPYSSDWIVDATKNKNNGSARMAFAEPSYIANAEYWGLNGNAVLKTNSYFKNGVGTLSAWVYFDGNEGDILTSSDEIIPDWKIKRTLEGNLVFSSGTISSIFPVPEQSWSFLTLVFDKTKVSVYVNGEFVKDISVAVQTEIMTPWIGIVGDGLFRIDELRYSDIALGKDWIRMDYVTQKLNKNDEGVGEYALVF